MHHVISIFIRIDRAQIVYLEGECNTFELVEMLTHTQQFMMECADFSFVVVSLN